VGVFEVAEARRIILGVSLREFGFYREERKKKKVFGTEFY